MILFIHYTPYYYRYIYTTHYVLIVPVCRPAQAYLRVQRFFIPNKCIYKCLIKLFSLLPSKVLFGVSPDKLKFVATLFGSDTH